MKNCNCTPNTCAYPCCMSLRERLAFDRAWSVKIKRPTEVDTDIWYQLREDFGRTTANAYERACRVPTWQGASLYEYGYEKPHFPLPAIPICVGIVMCRGLLGQCDNCIWPTCEMMDDLT